MILEGPLNIHGQGTMMICLPWVGKQNQLILKETN